jgi:hypothetical protein
MGGHIHFTALVEGYIQKRRSGTSNDDCNVPSAAISLGFNSREYKGSRCEVADIFCFERDWSVHGKNSDSPILLSATAGTTVDVSRPMKKRKLKDGKAVALDVMLEGL